MIRSTNHSIIFGIWFSLIVLLAFNCTSHSQAVLSPEVQIPIEFKKGWNLFSSPVVPPGFDISTLFQGKAIGSLWDFENSVYRKAENLETGRAYWIFLKEDLNLVFSYVPSESPAPGQR